MKRILFLAFILPAHLAHAQFPHSLAEKTGSENMGRAFKLSYDSVAVKFIYAKADTGEYARCANHVDGRRLDAADTAERKIDFSLYEKKVGMGGRAVYERSDTTLGYLQSVKYIFSRNGQLLGYNRCGEKGCCPWIYEYDKKDRLVLATCPTLPHKMEDRIEYEYDSKGRLIEISTYYMKELMERRNYEYRDDGLLLREKNDDRSPGAYQGTYTAEYTYCKVEK